MPSAEYNATELLLGSSLACGLSALLAFCGSAGVDVAEKEFLDKQRRALVHFARHPHASGHEMRFEPEPPMQFVSFADDQDKQEQRFSARLSLALGLGN